MIRVRVSDGGRVSKNSVIRRQAIANPSPLGDDVVRLATFVRRSTRAGRHYLFAPVMRAVKLADGVSAAMRKYRNAQITRFVP